MLSMNNCKFIAHREKNNINTYTHTNYLGQ